MQAQDRDAVVQLIHVERQLFPSTAVEKGTCNMVVPGIRSSLSHLVFHILIVHVADRTRFDPGKHLLNGGIEARRAPRGSAQDREFFKGRIIDVPVSVDVDGSIIRAFVPPCKYSEEFYWSPAVRLHAGAATA